MSSSYYGDVNPSDGDRVRVSVSNNKKGELAASVGKGVDALYGGEYKDAAQCFGRALSLDPQNSMLHFLNALSYHLLAENEDPSQWQQAEIGYKLAIQFDPHNWLAAQQLSRLYLENRSYRKAGEYSAYALLYRPDNIDMLYGLAAASYYGHDLETSLGAIGQAERINPGSPTVLYASAVINAASGRAETASDHLSRYRDVATDKADINYLEKRISEWRKFYDSNPRIMIADIGDSFTDESEEFTDAGSFTISSNDSDSDGDDSYESEDDNEDEIKNDYKTRMVVVDLTLIRGEEVAETSKGVNLLEGLTIQFGGSKELSRAISKDLITDTFSSKTSEKILSGTVTLPDITYSLNIFNSNTGRYDVIARPTLIALDGQRSEFFSGDYLHVGLVGENSSEISELPIGVLLAVTPKFISDDTVQLLIEAERSSYELGSIGTFSESIWTSKNKISANVVLKFGETLILGGMTDRQKEEQKTGVPLLKSIPVVQYLFSNEETVNINRSDLILVTPRRSDVSSDNRDTDERSLTELRETYSEWFSSKSNVEDILDSLKDNRFYREFRKGDIEEDCWWGSSDGFNAILKEAVSYLYF